VIADRAGPSGERVRLMSMRFAETGGDVWATIGRMELEFSPVTRQVEAKLIALGVLAAAGGAFAVVAAAAEEARRTHRGPAGPGFTPPSARCKYGTSSPPEEVLDHSAAR